MGDFVSILAGGPSLRLLRKTGAHRQNMSRVKTEIELSGCKKVQEHNSRSGKVVLKNDVTETEILLGPERKYMKTS